MKKLEPIAVDFASLSSELQDFENFLGQSPHLQEREQIIPFFKNHIHLTASLGSLMGKITLPQLYANELQLFGDFTADAASGDKDDDTVCLIEFEDATRYSIFSKLEHGKTVKSYSKRFEHGFSQIVDWAWRISSEKNSDAYARIFGSKMVRVSYMIIIGRDSDLTDEDLLRLRWRMQHISIDGVQAECLTFDAVLRGLRRRLTFANATPAAIT